MSMTVPYPHDVKCDLQSSDIRWILLYLDRESGIVGCYRLYAATKWAAEIAARSRGGGTCQCPIAGDTNDFLFLRFFECWGDLQKRKFFHTMKAQKATT